MKRYFCFGHGAGFTACSMQTIFIGIVLNK